MKELDIDNSYPIRSSNYLAESYVPKAPTVLTRFEKGQSLSHAEMDTNLTSLLHTASFSSSADYTGKPIKEANYCTLHYASQSLADGEEPTVCRGSITFQCMPSADDVRKKLADEEIPGTLRIAESLTVSGSSELIGDVKARSNLNVRGNTAIAENLEVTGSVRIVGSLYVNDIITEKNFAYLTDSDIRLKTNIRPVEDGLRKLNFITPIRFDWNEKSNHSGSDIGFAAQELQNICPEAVQEGADGYLKVDYTKVIPLLVSAVRELNRKIETR